MGTDSEVHEVKHGDRVVLPFNIKPHEACGNVTGGTSFKISLYELWNTAQRSCLPKVRVQNEKSRLLN
jgi:hypothetical protein